MWPLQNTMGLPEFLFFQHLFLYFKKKVKRKVNKAAQTSTSLMWLLESQINPKGRILEVGEGRELLGVVVNFGYTFLTTPPPWTLPPNPKSRVWISCFNLQIWVLFPKSEAFLPPALASPSEDPTAPRGGNICPADGNQRRKKKNPKLLFQLFFSKHKNQLQPQPLPSQLLHLTLIKHSKNNIYTEFEGTFFFFILKSLSSFMTCQHKCQRTERHLQDSAQPKNNYEVQPNLA